MLLTAAILVAFVMWLAAREIVRELRAAREERAGARAVAILQTFAPAIEAARSDPRALLLWHPLAQAVRQLFPVECAELDKAAGQRFPFPQDQVEAAHAQWTADWLAWERAHDAEYKHRAAIAEQELAASGGSPAARAKLEAIEREKLDLYQRRYQDYVRVAKALQNLINAARPGV